MDSFTLSAFFIGLSTAFFGIFAIHILFFRHERTRFQTVLGCVMAVWTILTAKDLVLVMPHMYTERVLDWVLLIDGWSAISYTVFLFEIIMPHRFSWRRLLLLTIPFVLFTVAYAIWPSQWVIYAYAAFLWFYAWGIVIFGYVKAHRHIKYVRENYSYIDNIDVSWLRPVFIFVIATQLIWLYASLFPSVWTDILYYISSIAFWLMVLHYSWNFRPISEESHDHEADFTTEEPKVADGKEEDHDILNAPMRQYAFAEKMEQLMDSQQLYLNQDLTLEELAAALGTNRTYISNYLNTVKGTNFYDYINQKRIELVSVPLLREHPEYTLEHVANASGFRSISTFRRTFIKLTGQKPSDFCKSL